MYKASTCSNYCLSYSDYLGGGSIGLKNPYIINNGKSNAYFFMRKFGNLLVGNNELIKDQQAFFESRGGLYRQFLLDQNKIDQSSQSLFYKFGASAIIQPEIDDLPFDPLLRFERSETEFYDPDVKTYQLDNSEQWSFWLRLKDSGRVYLFLGEEILIDANQWRFTEGINSQKREKILKTLRQIQENEAVDFCCPVLSINCTPPLMMTPKIFEDKINQLNQS